MERIFADDLVSTAAEIAALAALRRAVGTADSVMERHCVRVFFIVERLAALLGRPIDREVALCACLLFEIGAYPAAATGDVYTRDGARHALEVLRPFGWSRARRQRCADAIERHHQLRPQWTLGAEVELLRRADLVDTAPALFRGPITKDWLTQLFVRVPRAGLYRHVAALVAGMLRDRPATIRRIFSPPPRPLRLANG